MSNCGKQQEPSILLSQNRPTLLACLEELRSQIEQKKNGDCAKVAKTLESADHSAHLSRLEELRRGCYIVHPAHQMRLGLCLHACHMLSVLHAAEALNFIPKLYLRLLWFFRRTAALFCQIRTFPQLFRFCSDLGNPGIRQILINLCGNNNVRNCDLLQSDFFDRCRTVLGVAKGFFWYVVKLGKR